jgi:hypothetical protein
MQNTWKTFTSLGDAIDGTRGNTQISIGLVRENLFVGETVEWVATSTVNDFGEWKDGCIVVTNQRIFAAYVDTDLQQTYGNMVARFPVPQIAEYQGGGQVTNFAIEGLPYQALALTPTQLNEFRALLANSDMTTTGPAPSQSQTTSEDPTLALSKVKELLDAGLINAEEYEIKKREVLDRI